MTSVSESMLAEPAGLELRTGDCLTREEFHRVYSQMPAPPHSPNPVNILRRLFSRNLPR